MDGKPKVGLVSFQPLTGQSRPIIPNGKNTALHRDQIREEGLLDLPEIESSGRSWLRSKIERVHICVPSVAKCVPNPPDCGRGTVRAGQLVTAGKTERALPYYVRRATMRCGLSMVPAGLYD